MKDLPATLEQLFTGATKKMRVKTTQEVRDYRRPMGDKILVIEIKPGMKAGTKFKFKGAGDEIKGVTQDLHFVLKEQKHDVFVRNDEDLHTMIELTLKEALTGWEKRIKTIDGKDLPVIGAGPTQPGSVQKFPGQGMPFRNRAGQRGDLVVTVKIIMPMTLTKECKQKLTEILR